MADRYVRISVEIAWHPLTRVTTMTVVEMQTGLAWKMLYEGEWLHAEDRDAWKPGLDVAFHAASDAVKKLSPRDAFRVE